MISNLATVYKLILNNSRRVELIINKNKLSPVLSGLGMATSLVSSGASAYSVSQGQAEGGIGDFFKGFADLSREDYHENGGAEAGTVASSAGKTAQNLSIGLLNVILGSSKLKISRELKNTLSKGIVGLMAWQSLSLGDEFVRPDHTNGLVDGCDMFGGGLSILALNSTLRNLRKRSR
jgi:hypothetical protein